MKAIIIGTSLSGKTTIIQELRKIVSIPVSEMDEELTRLNNGEYPSDFHLKNNILVPKITEEVLNQEEIIFFTNTDYFSKDDLQRAKIKGFKICMIQVSKEELKKRNESRIKNKGYQDQEKWLDGMLKYQENLIENGLVDRVIDGNQQTSQIVFELLSR